MIHVDRRAVRHIDLFGKVMPHSQVNVSIINPGITEAFHMHRRQDDFWVVVSGTLFAYLYDEKTRQLRTFILCGGTVAEMSNGMVGDIVADPLFIPAGVWHGYRNPGKDEAVLVYYVTKKYDKNDEFRKSPAEFGITL